ncbi:MAG: Peptidase family [Candidatus Parcubacteria bacterium]|jgi:murein DD-endopeptidase MepM/ murein hydrolase activator NlpD|nr:Peptidase family [Candidatus Parcubacteria bacterium]
MPERLKLGKPITPLVVMQRFGEDLACVDTATRTKCIARTPNGTCPDGYESLYASAGLKGHNGLDLMASEKQPVYAATDGTVYELVSEKERGIGVEIVSKEYYVLDGVAKPYCVKTRYWHLHSYTVEPGQKI